MRLLRDEVYRLIAIAKGDLSATPEERAKAQGDYRALLDALTRELPSQSSDLAITHESVRGTVEQAYRNARSRKERAAARRKLQSDG